VLSRRAVGILVIVALPAAGGNISVLVDVSGTMGHYGAWQGDARDLVVKTLTGRNDSFEGWEHVGDLGVASEFALHAGDQVHVLGFGSTQQSAFPFFTDHRVVPFSASMDLPIPLDRSAYNQARTNKSLAQSVGATLATGEDGTARVIIISDFLIDSSLTTDQQNFVNSFEAKANIESPLILSWHRDQHVQVKFLRIKIATTSSPPPPDKLEVRLGGAQLLDSPKRLLLRWSAIGTPQPETFSLAIQESGSGRIVFSRQGLYGTSLVVTSLRPGKYVWRVVADLPGDTHIASPQGIVDVPGSGGSGVVIFIIFLASAAFGLWRFLNRRKLTAAATAVGKDK